MDLDRLIAESLSLPNKRKRSSNRALLETCDICGDKASKQNHYGSKAHVCFSCRFVMNFSAYEFNCDIGFSGLSLEDVSKRRKSQCRFNATVILSKPVLVQSKLKLDQFAGIQITSKINTHLSIDFQIVFAVTVGIKSAVPLV